MPRINRRQFLVYGSTAVGTSILLKACGSSEPVAETTAPEEDVDTSAVAASGGDVIKVGLLHSQSGAMAIRELALIDAEELAIKEINTAGGVLDKQIEPIKRDGVSNAETFAEQAERLIDQDQVSVVFGCLTSSSRKAVRPIFEAKNHMLWYPGQYEGQECSRNIFYTGTIPNQQIEPAVDWLLDNKGKNFFLVGSDEAFPRVINNIIKEKLKLKEGNTVGEDYLPFGSTEVSPIITKIKTDLPDGGVIFNSFNSYDTNVEFFKQLQNADMGTDKYPVMSIGIGEEDIRSIGLDVLKGHYVVSNYFQTIDSDINSQWLEAFKATYGNNLTTNAAMEAAYIAVYLWKQAVEQAGTTDIAAVRKAVYGQTFEAPAGIVTMNSNHHLSKTVRIGEVREDGPVDIVLTTDAPVDPSPWNHYIPATEGYLCDWSDPAKGGKYKPA
jgi:urea transport system substrate-binding protein